MLSWTLSGYSSDCGHSPKCSASRSDQGPLGVQPSEMGLTGPPDRLLHRGDSTSLPRRSNRNETRSPATKPLERRARARCGGPEHAGVQQRGEHHRILSARPFPPSLRDDLPGLSQAGEHGFAVLVVVEVAGSQECARPTTCRLTGKPAWTSARSETGSRDCPCIYGSGRSDLRRTVRGAGVTDDMAIPVVGPDRG